MVVGDLNTSQEVAINELWFSRLLVGLTERICVHLALPVGDYWTEDRTSLLLLSELLSSLLAILPHEEGRQVRERLVLSTQDDATESSTVIGDMAVKSSGIISCIIELITHLSEKKEGSIKGSAEESDDTMNILLQLLGNLLFGCPCAQNLLRECGGLFRVLSLCHTNVRQPLRREWAVLALRNACEGNMENQRSIEELTLQKVNVVNEDLRNSGLQVKFNQSLGKIEFS